MTLSIAMTLVQLPILFGISLEVYFFLLCIGIPTFFFWKWLYQKFVTDKTARTPLTWISTLITTPVLYASLALVSIFFLMREPSSDFDQAVWLTDREGRFAMGDVIVESKMLIGKDSIQLKELLGQPTWRGDTENLWMYDMGTGGSLGFLFHNLSVHFENDTVDKVEHHRIND